MGSSFKPSDALKAVRRSPGEQTDQQPTSSLNKDYYDLTTGEPISFDNLTKRIKKRFLEMDKATVGAMLDLVFAWANFSSFYKREESFKDYLKALNISRNHAYGIINSVGLLTQYFAHKGEAAPELGLFLQEIGAAIDGLGIKRLIIISQIKSEERRFDLVERLLAGEAITADELEEKVERKSPLLDDMSVLDGKVSVAGSALLTFQPSIDQKLQKLILLTIAKYFKKAKK